MTWKIKGCKVQWYNAYLAPTWVPTRLRGPWYRVVSWLSAWDQCECEKCPFHIFYNCVKCKHLILQTIEESYSQIESRCLACGDTAVWLYYGTMPWELRMAEREEVIEAGCTCHINPPCGYCVEARCVGADFEGTHCEHWVEGGECCLCTDTGDPSGKECTAA